jgi:predicted transcriptional regulator
MMKRVTIRVEEEVLHECMRLARLQDKSLAAVVREALAGYVMVQRGQAWAENPLMAIAGIGESEEPMDVSNGGDEEILMAEIHPLYGWRGNDRS